MLWINIQSKIVCFYLLEYPQNLEHLALVSVQ